MGPASNVLVSATDGGSYKEELVSNKADGATLFTIDSCGRLMNKNTGAVLNVDPGATGTTQVYFNDPTVFVDFPATAKACTGCSIATGSLKCDCNGASVFQFDGDGYLWVGKTSSGASFVPGAALAL